MEVFVGIEKVSGLHGQQRIKTRKCPQSNNHLILFSTFGYKQLSGYSHIKMTRVQSVGTSCRPALLLPSDLLTPFWEAHLIIAFKQFLFYLTRAVSTVHGYIPGIVTSTHRKLRFYYLKGSVLKWGEGQSDKMLQSLWGKSQTNVVQWIKMSFNTTFEFISFLGKSHITRNSTTER